MKYLLYEVLTLEAFDLRRGCLLSPNILCEMGSDSFYLSTK
jgi:hypothetical protein